MGAKNLGRVLYFLFLSSHCRCCLRRKCCGRRKLLRVSAVIFFYDKHINPFYVWIIGLVNNRHGSEEADFMDAIVHSQSCTSRYQECQKEKSGSNTLLTPTAMDFRLIMMRWNLLITLVWSRAQAMRLLRVTSKSHVNSSKIQKAESTAEAAALAYTRWLHLPKSAANLRNAQTANGFGYGWVPLGKLEVCCVIFGQAVINKICCSCDQYTGTVATARIVKPRARTRTRNESPQLPRWVSSNQQGSILILWVSLSQSVKFYSQGFGLIILGVILSSIFCCAPQAMLLLWKEGGRDLSGSCCSSLQHTCKMRLKQRYNLSNKWCPESSDLREVAGADKNLTGHFMVHGVFLRDISRIDRLVLDHNFNCNWYWNFNNDNLIQDTWAMSL